jgi:hypothetical protein
MVAPRRESLSLSEWIGVFELFAPQSFAFDWDSGGLQVGDPGKSIRRVAAALEERLRRQWRQRSNPARTFWSSTIL